MDAESPAHALASKLAAEPPVAPTVMTMRLMTAVQEGDTDSEQLQVDAEDGVLDAFVHIRCAAC